MRCSFAVCCLAVTSAFPLFPTRRFAWASRQGLGFLQNPCTAKGLAATRRSQPQPNVPTSVVNEPSHQAHSTFGLLLEAASGGALPDLLPDLLFLGTDVARLYHCVEAATGGQPWIVKIGPSSDSIRQTSDGEMGAKRAFVLPDVQNVHSNRVMTQDISRTEGGLGHTVSDSGVALAALLTDSRSEWYQDLNGKHVLELGSGPGVTGKLACT